MSGAPQATTAKSNRVARRRYLRRLGTHAAAAIGASLPTPEAWSSVEQIPRSGLGNVPKAERADTRVRTASGDFVPMSESAIDGCVEETFELNETRRRIFRVGRGPVVLVMHELPGLSLETVEFAEDLAAQGFHVVLPLLFGEPGQVADKGALHTIGICVRHEFDCLAGGRASRAVAWLGPLCDALHERFGGPGIGVVGMCLTAGIVLTMMRRASVIAPVSAQPALPFLPLGALDIDADELADAVGQSERKPLLLLRFEHDSISNQHKLKTLCDAFANRGQLKVYSIEGDEHSTLVYSYAIAKARGFDTRVVVAAHLKTLLTAVG